MSGIAGTLLVYAAWFMYEDAERNVQNTLERWWVEIDDFRKTAVGLHVAFLNVAAMLATAALDRLFGRRLLSVRALAVAACLSLASLHYAATLTNDFARALVAAVPAETIERDHPQREGQIVAAVAYIGGVVTQMFLTPAIEDHPEHMNLISALALSAVVISSLVSSLRWLPTFVLFSIATLFTTLSFFPRDLTVLQPRTVGVAILTGIVFDGIAFPLIRTLLKRQAIWRSVTAVLFAALAEFAIFLFVSIAPLLTGALVVAQAINLFRLYGVQHRIAWFILDAGWSLMLSSLTNALSGSLALIFFICGLLLLLHRIFWPILERPLYRLQRIGLFGSKGSRGALLGLGAALLATSFGYAPKIVSHVCALFGSA